MEESVFDKYEPVIGLEVHAQLLTKSKAFSSDRNEYGGMPNTHVSPVSLGHPGTLPVLNEKSIEFAIKLGLACGSNITEYNGFARKNYFYADLPKGYQITQDTTPICTGGNIRIKLDSGEEKHVGLTRIHMEEDSGKSLHDQSPFETFVDLNRAGVPLLEIVSEPDMRSSEEAYAYLTEVRKLVRYLEICDGNMEEGSLRCDANVSVKLKGDQTFGTRVEIKNLNSIRNVKRAIDFEFRRHVEAIESGEEIFKETRGFNAANGQTNSMRTKEDANDYRYFPEPDLQPFIVTEQLIGQIRNEIPALPHELFAKYVDELGLSEYDAGVLTDNKEIALYFDQLVSYTKNFKAAANWMMGEVKGYLNEMAIGIDEFPVSPENLADLIALIDENKVSNTMASQQLFPAMIQEPQKKPGQIAQEKNLVQMDDGAAIQGFIEEVLGKYPEKVTEYRNGKKGLIGLFMGEVMKLSKGKAEPKKTSLLIQQALEKA